MKSCLWLLILSASAVGQPVSFDWDYTVSGVSAEHRDSVLFGPALRDNTQSLDALLDVQFNGYGITGLFAAKGNHLYRSDESLSYSAELIVQELFWQGSADQLPFDFTLGKVRLDWGVGYGYRPLDLFKPYRRNPVGIQVEEGTGTAMLSYFDLSGEWSLVYNDSSWTQQSTSMIEQASQQQGIGLRRYWLDGDNEWQGLAYYDDVRHGTMGGSVVSVINPAWAVHASTLYQRQYLSYQVLRFGSPVELTQQPDGYQMLIGLNWANEVGNNIIVEYWYDSRSWSQNQWQSALDDVARLSADTTTQAVASSYAQGLSHANLVQHNLMFHWSLDSSSWSQWGWAQDQLWLNDVTPTFDLLYSPQDQGVIATQWLKYTIYDSGSVSFLTELAARFMTGDKRSIYANLPDKRMIFINLRGKF